VKDSYSGVRMRLLREVRRPRLLLLFPIALISVTFLASRAHMTYEAELDARGRMWEESGGLSRQSGSSRGLNSEVKGGEKGGEAKSERNIEIPLFQAKQGGHLKKSSHSESESAVGGHRPVKKYSEDDFDRTNLILNSEKSTGKAKVRGARLWASLSICWGSNAQMFNKEKFPYAETAYYAAVLWRNQSHQEVEVVMTIVSEFDLGENVALDSYIDRVESIPATVILQKSNMGDCVLQAQVTRMWAFQYKFIQPSDIIIMADADAFVIGEEVVGMLDHKARVWVAQFEHTRANGGTLILPLTAMTSQDWKHSLDFSTRKEGGPVGMSDVTEYFKKVSAKGIQTGFGFDSDKQAYFEVDQVILSSALLRPDRQLCSLPPDNPLWTRLSMTPREIDDTELCFHGKLLNCFRINWSGPGSRVRLMDMYTLYQQFRGTIDQGCPWWHFVSTDTEEYIKQVFQDILTGVLNGKGRKGKGALEEVPEFIQLIGKKVMGFPTS